jgi:hypothetical protein
MSHRTLSALLAAILPGTFCMATAHPAPAQVEPKVFAAQVINAPAGVDCLTFTPDGNTVYFDREAKAAITVMLSRRVRGTWSTPQVAPFSGKWLDHDPVVAPDGSFLVYTSNRPDSADGKPVHGGRLWRVDRRGEGWSEPVRFPDVVNSTTHTYAPAVAANGDVYYQQSNPPGQDFRLYRSAYRNGSYQAPEQLALGDPAAHKLDPAIAPDASFIVFDANYAGKEKPDHLYIAFREGNRWGKPVDMGDALNLYQPWGSHLGPDQRTLYFTSDHALPDQRANGHAETLPTGPGINHIWSVSLAPWLQAHRQRSGGAA